MTDSTGLAWPETAVAIAGIAFVTVVLSVTIWQLLATGRAGLSARREQAYRRIAETAGDAQRTTADRLEQVCAELAQVRRQTSELERMLKQVE